MANHIYIATSLDGYIAQADGGLDWLEEIPNPDGSDWGWAEFIAGIDAIVMGRKTFEKVLTFPEWPYSLPVFVLSTSLTAIPEGFAGGVELFDLTPVEVVRTLKRRGHQNLYIDGGRTIQGFLEHDLIDTLTITRVPILLGSGIPLFENHHTPLDFDHVSTQIYNNHLVKSRYVRCEVSRGR